MWSDIIIILTTLPHLTVPYQAGLNIYGIVSFMSSSMSVIWHVSNTGGFEVLGIIDHSLAVCWSLLDVYMFYNTEMFGTMLFLNLGTVALNWGAGLLDKHNILSYWVGHSIWHLISSYKSIYLVNKLNTMQLT